MIVMGFVQGVMEHVAASPLQWVGGVSGLVGIVGVGLRWDRRFTRMDAKLKTMWTREDTKDYISGETRVLRDEITGIVTDMQASVADATKTLTEMEVRCAKRHGQNGVM